MATKLNTDLDAQSKYAVPRLTRRAIRPRRRGEDFACSALSFRTRAYAAAKARGLKLITRASGEADCIQIQAIPREVK